MPPFQALPEQTDALGRSGQGPGTWRFWQSSQVIPMQVFYWLDFKYWTDSPIKSLRDPSWQQIFKASEVFTFKNSLR